jgi:uncharacterized protein YrzB (UPF0473 family)
VALWWRPLTDREKVELAEVPERDPERWREVEETLSRAMEGQRAFLRAFLRFVSGAEPPDEVVEGSLAVWNVTGMACAVAFASTLAQGGDPDEALAAVASMFTEDAWEFISEGLRAAAETEELREHFKRRRRRGE